jgi:hypothetical protein
VAHGACGGQEPMALWITGKDHKEAEVYNDLDFPTFASHLGGNL